MSTAYLMHRYNSFTGETYRNVAVFTSELAAQEWFDRHFAGTDVRLTLSPIPLDPVAVLDVG